MVSIFPTKVKGDSLKLSTDERKPTCARCEKAGYTCAGYSKPLHFRIAVPSASSSTSASEPADTAVTIRFRARRHAHQATPTVPSFLSLEAFRPDICHAFLFENFVWRSYGQSWLPLAATGRFSPLALQATSALSQSNFGRLHAQQDLETNASVEYGKAIRTLIPALSQAMNPRVGVEAHMLLIPVMILLVYESQKENPVGSASHVRGLMQLLMICGPERFQTQPLRSAFESCRATLITVGVISRKRSFLEDEEWMSVPWALEPAMKSEQNKLADILVTVPGMLEDDVQLAQRDDPDLRDRLVERIQRQLTKLYQWRWRWQALYADTVFEEEASRKLSDHGDARHLFESRLRFSSFERATEICLYNAVQMWLMGILWKTAPGNASTIILSAAQLPIELQGVFGWRYSTPLSLPGTSVSLRDPAIEVCRVFEFQAENVSHSQEPALFYMLPVGLAYSVLEHNPPYRGWLVSMLDKSPVTKKYVVGQNSMGFGFYLSSSALHDAISKIEGEEKIKKVGVWHGLQSRKIS